MIQESVQIIEENEYFMVINKPQGLSVHNQSPSLADYLKRNKKPLHFVNRLDQDTSGLVIVAQEPEWHEPLAVALDLGQKIYRALLRSPWKKPEKDVIWSWPISDKAEGRQNPQGKTADRVPAETRVKILRSNQYFTEIEADLLTGRQHQIRKHAAIAKHPIVGDKRYNEEKYNTNITKYYENNRMLLHAEKIKFEFNNKNYNFKTALNLDNFFI